MSAIDDITQAYHKYINCCLTGNIEAFTALLADDVVGVGMGEQGFITSVEKCREVFLRCLKKDESPQYTLNFVKTEIRMQGERNAHLCGKIYIECTKDGHTVRSGLMQTLGLSLQDGQWKVCLFHASPVMLSEESVNAYPFKFADKMLETYRANLEKESRDLIYSHVCGGILAFSIKGKTFPLEYVNAELPEILGYTLEEFEELFKADVAGLGHPDELALISSYVYEAAETKTDYQKRLRMRKKDGSWLWMLATGKSILGEDGRSIQISLFVDISEMVQLQDELQEQSRALAISEERFRIALEKTSSIIFEYDIRNQTVFRFTKSRQVHLLENAAHGLFPQGSLAGDQLATLQKAFDAVRQGEHQVQCVVAAHIDGAAVWNRISMTGISNNDGTTIRAVGIVEDITLQKEAEMAYAREEQYRKTAMASLLGMYDINFSKNVFEHCQSNHAVCVPVQSGTPYEELVLSAAFHQHIHEAYRQDFINAFSRARVVDAFSQGIREIHFEYRAATEDRPSFWVRATLRMLLDATSSEIKGFFYLADIDKEKNETLELRRKSELDLLTGLYNKVTAQQRISRVLESVDESTPGVLLVLDVDYFKSINDSYGHPFGDSILVGAARVLRENFRESDILGRLGGDEFCVFFTGVGSPLQIKLIAGRICAAIRSLHTPEQEGMPGTSCSVGIATCKGADKDFETLYGQADHALYVSKQNGRNGYTFYDDGSGADSPENTVK